MSRDLKTTALNRSNRSPLSAEATRRKHLAQQMIDHRDPQLTGITDAGLLAELAWALAGKFLDGEAEAVRRQHERDRAVAKRLDELARGT